MARGMAAGKIAIIAALLLRVGALAPRKPAGHGGPEKDVPQRAHKFVLLTHGRSGHALLRNMLNSRPDIQVAGEELARWSDMEKCATAKQGKVSWETGPTMKELIQSFTEFFSGTHPTCTHINGKFADCYPTVGASPVPHWKEGNESTIRGLTWVADTQGGRHDPRLDDMGQWFVNNNIKVILLTRKNFVDHYISHLKVADEKTTVDIAHLKEAAGKFQQMHDKYNKFKSTMNKEGHHVFDVSFEDLGHNSSEVLGNLQKFFWLEPKPMHAEYRRVHPRLPTAYIKNWEEVSEAAKKAVLPKYLAA